MARKTTNYLNNRDLLTQIHKSKSTFCQFDDPAFADFDYIVTDLASLTDDQACREEFDMTVEEMIQDAKEKKVRKLKRDDPDGDHEVSDIMTGELVFRLMTYEHIPEDPDWPEGKEKKKPKEGHLKVPFPPFQHYILENGIPRLVGMSHYKDDEFSADHGRINSELGKMFMLLVEKISKKGNWRNYTYIDEMRSSALLQLSQVGLQFDESRGQIPNPFAFYTTVISNAFKRVLNTEKKVRDIRDDLIQLEGEMPSFTRQLEDSLGQQNSTDNATKQPPNINAKNAKGKKK